MKLKNSNLSCYESTTLKFLNIYSTKKNLSAKRKINPSGAMLQKLTKIITSFHMLNQKILFLNFPMNFAQILVSTKHLAIPDFIWQNGLISNKNLNYKKKLKTKDNTLKLKAALQKKANLIILYDFTNNFSILEESYRSNIPVIVINKKLEITAYRPMYQAIGSYHFAYERVKNNFFFNSFIQSALIRAKKIKNKYEHSKKKASQHSDSHNFYEILPPKNGGKRSAPQTKKKTKS